MTSNDMMPPVALLVLRQSQRGVRLNVQQIPIVAGCLLIIGRNCREAVSQGELRDVGTAPPPVRVSLHGRNLGLLGARTRSENFEKKRRPSGDLLTVEGGF